MLTWLFMTAKVYLQAILDCRQEFSISGVLVIYYRIALVIQESSGMQYTETLMGF